MERTTLPVARRAVLFLMYKGDEYIEKALRSLKRHLKDMTATEEVLARKEIVRLSYHFQTKYTKSGRRIQYFEMKNKEWLDEFISFPSCLVRLASTPSPAPQTPFSETSSRTQRRKVAEISNSQSCETIPLLKATSRTLSKRGFEDAAAIIKETTKSPTRASKIRRLMKAKPREQNPFNAEAALALLLDLSLTKQQYRRLRKAVQLRGYNNIFPPYNTVAEAKLDCRPSPLGCLDVTDTEAGLPLQNLLDHTAKRLVKVQNEVILQDLSGTGSEDACATMVVAWGFDGSSNQSQYKQLPSAQHHQSFVDDSSLFATTINPLQVKREGGNVYWKNPAPQSIDFCRPLRLQFVKESQHLVLAVREEIGKQIESLVPCKVNLGDGKSITVKFDMKLTLIDGKILNFITGTKSMQVCPLCKATPLQFNHLENQELFEVQPENLVHGVSPLHCWIRFFECCLHISYKLDVKVWSVREDALKVICSQKKAEVQRLIRENMGLIVDVPKAGGSGTSNDGNTARRAFQNYILFASILGIDEELVRRFYTIIVAMSCQLPLNSINFGNYCSQTAELYVKLYPWYFMPASLHKILIHGNKISESSILPLGVLGEDAAESRNKFYRRFRERHARKISRKVCLQDVYERSLDTSDPVISTERRIFRSHQRTQPLPNEVLQLLQTPCEPEQPRQLQMDEDPDDFIVEDVDNLVLSDEEEI